MYPHTAYDMLDLPKGREDAMNRFCMTGQEDHYRTMRSGQKF